MILIRGGSSLAALLLLTFSGRAADTEELQGRRQRAAAAFSDGILLVHARSAPDEDTGRFRQDPVFYYLTGLENTVGAILAIDGRSRESWLFLPTRALYSKVLPPEGQPGSSAVQASGIRHVADWSELGSFLSAASPSRPMLYYVGDYVSADLPPNITGQPAPPLTSNWWNPTETPSWVVIIGNQWPSFQLKEARDPVYALMDVQSPSETVKLRAATKATVASVKAGIHAVRPGVSQRKVEEVMINGCWQAGARNSGWPWAMSGPNDVFPVPQAAGTRYHHLDRVMKAGELVRIDWGCSVDHYDGDLGRTIPVSGRFTAEQGEIWNAFVAAYHAGVTAIREGATTSQVFTAWSSELMRHHETVKTPLARQAIETWSKRENVPDWQLHTLTPNAGYLQDPFRAGTSIAFEPIASISGQGYYLEDNFVITSTGTELLTPGVPYTAEEIEAVMRAQGRKSQARH